MFGEEHPNTLKCMVNLASTLASLGQYKDAEKLQDFEVKGKISVLGPEHLSTLMSLGNLASSISSQGRYAEAKMLHMHVYAVKYKGPRPTKPRYTSEHRKLCLRRLPTGAV